jgi:hypothetical protein
VNLHLVFKLDMLAHISLKALHHPLVLVGLAAFVPEDLLVLR